MASADFLTTENAHSFSYNNHLDLKPQDTKLGVGGDRTWNLAINKYDKCLLSKGGSTKWCFILKDSEKQIFKEMLAQISTKISFMDRDAKSYTK